MSYSGPLHEMRRIMIGEDSNCPEGGARHKYQDADGDVGTQLQVLCAQLLSSFFLLSTFFPGLSFLIVLSCLTLSHFISYLMYYSFCLTHFFQENSQDNTANTGSRHNNDQNNTRIHKSCEENKGSTSNRFSTSTSTSTSTPLLLLTSNGTRTLRAEFNSGPTLSVPSAIHSLSTGGKRYGSV